MKVLVCDDEQLARDRLVRLVDRVEGCEVTGEAENGLEAIDKVSELEPDLVFMDIQMPGMTGLEAAEHIAKLSSPPAIVFCTAYNEYAIDAFQVNAVGYLLKPVRREDLSQALKQAKALNKVQLKSIGEELEEPKEKSNTRSHISAKTHRGIELIPISNVRYFKADQKYVSVRHIEGEVLVDETLKEFEEELGEQFVRVHRNALVSIEHISGLEMVSAGHYQVCMKDIDEKVQVSRRHVSGLRKLFKSL